MKKERILLTIGLLFAMIMAKAQDINGISINNRNEKIIVVLDGQRVSEGTNSCFIANLRRGSYRIQVYRASDITRHPAHRKMLYNETVSFTGHGVQTIEIASHSTHEDFNNGYERWHVMNDNDFQDFYKTVKEECYNSHKWERINMLPADLYFTSAQCRDLAELFTYESDKKKLLKQLYPKVVDQELFFKAIDVLFYSSSKREVTDFIKKYNKQQ